MWLYYENKKMTYYSSVSVTIFLLQTHFLLFELNLFWHYCIVQCTVAFHNYGSMRSWSSHHDFIWLSYFLFLLLSPLFNPIKQMINPCHFQKQYMIYFIYLLTYYHHLYEYRCNRYHTLLNECYILVMLFCIDTAVLVFSKHVLRVHSLLCSLSLTYKYSMWLYVGHIYIKNGRRLPSYLPSLGLLITRRFSEKLTFSRTILLSISWIKGVFSPDL